MLSYNIDSFYTDILNKLFFPNIKQIVIFFILLLFVSIILFIIISYVIIKFLKVSMDNTNIFFYQYNKKSQKILDLYGDHKIRKMYLLRQPFSKFITFVLNILTFYNYDSLIKESQDNFPYHTGIVFEIELTNGLNKLLLLEKNNCINITDNFLINSQQEIKELHLKKKKYTINEILCKTQDRLGNEKYFNWHLYKNNCQEYTKEILKTIGKYTLENKEYIFRDKLMNIIIPSDFTLHIGNCLFILYNIVEKYIYDNDMFS